MAGESIGPDVFVLSLPGAVSWGSNTVSNQGVAGFSVATTSCNAGDANLLWVDDSAHHPVIRQNLYRLRDSRFEQIGTSWVKHGFLAENNGGCGDCPPESPENTTRLRPGCSDPYSGNLNGARTLLGPSSEVNAFTGEFQWPRGTIPSEVSSDRIGYRLQARHADLDPAAHSGAKFFVEGHYVTQDDATAGNSENNASHRAVNITPCQLAGWPIAGYCMGFDAGKPTQEMTSAIYAWRDQDPTVEITEKRVPAEGLFILGARVEQLGDGFWRYEYALYNLNSHRSAGSFRVTVGEEAIVRNIGFHDVNYHSGEPWDSTDWPGIREGNSIVWQTTPHATDPEANALRWSTLYNFRFEINSPPVESAAEVGLFRPGFPGSIAIRTRGPAAGCIDCNDNDICDLCDVSCKSPECDLKTCGQAEDCNNNGVPDEPPCEADCNANAIPDECDIADCPAGDLTCADCNGNTVPDGCEPDCDGDGLPDTCDLLDSDDDGSEDCDDLCPFSTPPNACSLPEMVTCRLPNFFCVALPPDICIDVHGGTPMCGEPPEERCDFGYSCVTAVCRDGCMVGDFDSDGDIDFLDYGAFESCFSGSLGEPSLVATSDECLLHFDIDTDGDVDLIDYRQIQAVLGTGLGLHASGALVPDQRARRRPKVRAD